MAERDFERVLQRLRALGDQSRLNLVGILSRGEQPVDELARLLQLKAPTVSHHLSVLKDAGLATVRPEGNVRYYGLDRRGLTSVAKSLRSPAALADLTESTELECWERRVLANFIDGEELKEDPGAPQEAPSDPALAGFTLR